MQRLLLIALLCAAQGAAWADESHVVSRIRLFIPDREALGRVWSAGVDHEGATGKPGGFMEFVAGPAERDELRRTGQSFETVVPDLAAEYAAEFTAGPVNALGFGTGSMGGYYTYTEIGQQLDSMRALYPAFITAKDTLTVTGGGRAIWIVKISDNADTDEPFEPEALYTALHHAREPQGMMTVLYYMWWLLENRASNPEAAYLVNNRQLWFVPVLNPDGYVYNQTTNPSGGGMWRKNRRNNGGSYGVDLNRNYGPFYMWNAPNGGSSTSPSSDTYRGPSEFSEPETFELSEFLRTRNVRTALNYHTYGNYLIYPYGYRSAESEDSLTFRDWTYEMTRTGRYTNGTDLQTVNYSTRGNSDDFMYADTTKPRTFAMTPEVGTTSFWPVSSLILPLAVENLRSNMIVSYASGQHTALRRWSVVEVQGNGSITPGEAFQLSLRMRNGGLGSATGLTISVAADVPWLQFPSPGSLELLDARSEADVLVAGTADSAAPAAGRARLVITTSDPEGYLRRDTVTLFTGTPVRLFTDNASAGTGLWSTGSGWGTTPQAFSPPAAFTDSPYGEYFPGADNSLTMLTPVPLTSYQHAVLRYQVWWDIEPTWDFATVEVSTNGGSTWIPQRTGMTRQGSGRSGGEQPANVYGYDSYSPGSSWTEEMVDLTPYAGQSVRVRFRLASDGGVERDGIRVDDVRIDGYTGAVPPAAAALELPPDGATGQALALPLVWRRAAGASTYHVQAATDSMFTLLVLNDSLLTDTVRQMSGLTAGTRYHWRVRARNIAGWGPYSGARSFLTVAPATVTATLFEGWNIVSLPLSVPDPRLAAVFPGSASPLFAFDTATGYRSEDTLRPGVGYWLKRDSAGAVLITGMPVAADTVPVAAGWNLVGTISAPVDTGDVVEVPAGIIVSGWTAFGTGYTPAVVLEPGRGYWVKCSAPGVLILGAPAEKSVRRQSFIRE